MRDHAWKKRKFHVEDNDYVDMFECQRCGIMADIVAPGMIDVPNLNGAIEIERDCDVEVVRRIMRS